MDVMIALGHPRVGSFNHALAEAIGDALRNDGHHIWSHDLYAEGFDPVLRDAELQRGCELTGAMRQHCEELANAEGLVIVHPSWWGQPPAVMKGWVDRVFRPGVAYRFEETEPGVGEPVGLLKAGRALVVNTSNSPRPQDWGGLGDPLETWWRNTVLRMCGVNDVLHLLLAPVNTSSDAQRAGWLDEVRRLSLDRFSVVRAV